MGSLQLDEDLELGEYRELTDEELEALKARESSEFEYGQKNEADGCTASSPYDNISICWVDLFILRMTSLLFCLLLSSIHGLGFEQGHYKLRHLNRAVLFEE